jgi:putative two-component system response regulator
MAKKPPRGSDDPDLTDDAQDGQAPAVILQTESDGDQTAADKDQTAADKDQAAADNDQTAADNDQAASDADLADGGDPEIHDASRDSRDHSAHQRRIANTKRGETGASRESVAKARDLAADARDHAADLLDLEMAQNEPVSIAAGSLVGESDESRTFQNGGRAVVERTARARARGAADRTRAAHDRSKAAEDRLTAQKERDALLRQLMLSEADGLTGARSRAPGLADLEIEIERARRTSVPLAVAYIDLIGLKAVNDAHGHSAGDALLQSAVQMIRAQLRPYDAIIRIGGDEFLCVLPGTQFEIALQRFDALRAVLADDSSQCNIRVGVAALGPDDTAADLIDRADSALSSRVDQSALESASISRVGRLASNQGLDRTRILITDDNPEMHRWINRALGDNYECEFAGNAQEAHEKLADGNYHLAICNLEAADSQGLKLAGEIIRAYPSIATVVLKTGEDDPDAARRAFELGVYGYLIEPFWPGQLLITVLNALRRRQLEIAAIAHSENLEERRQAIIDVVPIGIYAKDKSGHYVVANAKADELAGVERGGLMGLTDDAFMPAGEIDLGLDSDRRVLDEQTSHEREDTVKIGGVTKTFKTIRFPLMDEDGDMTAVGGVSMDVTVEREAMRLRDELAATQQRAIEELRLSRQETIEGLTKAIDLHDSSTGEHIERIGKIAAYLGSELGLDFDRVQLLRAAAPMHDVGKIGTSAEILRKPGPLSDEERKEMQLHAAVGYEIFGRFESDLAQMAGLIALTHHERYDGSGYPRGLVGTEIPCEGRITAVADVFDALLTDRSYRPAMSIDDAIGVMREGRGNQFDPQVVDVLINNVEEAVALRA